MKYKVLLVMALLLMPSFAWDADFEKRMPINISIGNNVADYQVGLNLTYDTSMMPDFSDVHFTDENDLDLYHYIEEKVNSDWALVWFKGDWNTLNGTQAYIYFENNTVITGWNDGFKTFPLFDDFGTGSLNTTFWTASAGSPTIAGGMLQMVRSGSDLQLDSTSTFTNNLWAVNFRGHSEDTAYNSIGFQVPGSSLYTILQSGVVASESRFYVRNETDQSGVETSHVNANLGTWAKYVIDRVTNSTLFMNDVLFAYSPNVRSSTAALPITLRARTGNQNLSVDYIFVRKSQDIIPVSILGTVETSDLNILQSPLYAHANNTITFSLTGPPCLNITKSWWFFNDTGLPVSYVAGNSTTHNFTDAGTFLVNVTGYDITSTSNKTGELTFSVYDDLTNISLSIDDHLPYLISKNYVYLNYSQTNGSPDLNESFVITLPNATVLTTLNVENLNYTIQNEGIHVVNLTVCDNYDDAAPCFSDTEQFKSWNITGGLTLVTAYNQTDNLLHQGLVGDSVTFTSASSLNWTLNGTTTQGTSTALTFDDSNYFYSSADYYHYNVSAGITWGTYSASEWFTAISARYTSGHALTCTANRYCLITSQQYCEIDCAKQQGYHHYGSTYTLSNNHGNSDVFSVNTDDDILNVSVCMNATAVLTNLYLDGTFTYYSAAPSGVNSSERTYAYQNASVTLSSGCTNANGKNYTYWALPDSYSNTVTMSILQGGVAIQDALVKVQKYMESRSSWVTVTSQITDVNGEVQVEIMLCPSYYKIIVEKDGTVLYDSTDPVCIKSTAHTINIDTNLEDYLLIYYGVSSTCSWNNVTEYLECSVTDSSGQAVSSNLKVWQDWMGTEVCDVSETSSTTTLICDLSGYSDGVFSYEFYVTSNSNTYLANSGQIYKGTKTEDYGTDGRLILFLLISSVIIMAIKIPVLIPVVTIVVLWGAYAVNLVDVSPAVIGSLSVIAAIVLFEYWRNKR